MNRRPCHRAVINRAVLGTFTVASLAAPVVWILRPHMLKTTHLSWKKVLGGLTPVDAVMASAWLLTALAVTYLVIACVTITIAGLTGHRPLIDLIAKAMPAFLRGSVASAFLLAVTTMPAGAVPRASAAGTDTDGVAVMHIADNADSASTSANAIAQPNTTFRPATDSANATTAPPATASPPATTAKSTTADLPSGSPPAPIPTEPQNHYTVQRGDNFWNIAARTLTARRAQAPSEDEIAQYWLRLIDANRSRLADSHNPDLIFTGQQFVLPEY